MNKKNFDKIIVLDVRPQLQAGQDPFAIILKTAASLPEQSALKLIAPFKPVPMIQVLARRGLKHEAETDEEGNWIVWFYHSENKSTPEIQECEVRMAQLHKENLDLRERLKLQEGQWMLDVRGLRMPGPMEATLQVLERLPDQTILLQLNERAPQFLFPLLAQKGFSYESEVTSDGVITRIWK